MLLPCWHLVYFPHNQMVLLGLPQRDEVLSDGDDELKMGCSGQGALKVLNVQKIVVKQLKLKIQ